ncbi:hypothetical protein CBR_g31509 [Chara braunii]|uniref:Uncharacterized protein n=1 Tax=Chara braunii TaxID=69332 RepID=A0A388LFI7_CHABU|nr:hypothetical protein CBR_g31509 [Chara braunii]|eukprot:GBG80952.1 hypothetical protein CBR_g31509 [Chara braunii]
MDVPYCQNPAPGLVVSSQPELPLSGIFPSDAIPSPCVGSVSDIMASDIEPERSTLPWKRCRRLGRRRRGLVFETSGSVLSTKGTGSGVLNADVVLVRDVEPTLQVSCRDGNDEQLNACLPTLTNAQDSTAGPVQETSLLYARLLSPSLPEEFPGPSDFSSIHNRCNDPSADGIELPCLASTLNPSASRVLWANVSSPQLETTAGSPFVEMGMVGKRECSLNLGIQNQDIVESDVPDACQASASMQRTPLPSHSICREDLPVGCRNGVRRSPPVADDTLVSGHGCSYEQTGCLHGSPANRTSHGPAVDSPARSVNHRMFTAGLVS